MEPEKIARRFFEELWNRRQFEVADDIIATDCVTHQLRSDPGPVPADSRGPEVIKDHIRAWLVSFPDLCWEIEEIVSDDERVVTWARARGTHQATWQGIPPSGRELVIRCVVMHRVVAGKIKEDWVLTEAFGLYQQLGIVPPIASLVGQAQQS